MTAMTGNDIATTLPLPKGAEGFETAATSGWRERNRGGRGRYSPPDERSAIRRGSANLDSAVTANEAASKLLVVFFKNDSQYEYND